MNSFCTIINAAYLPFAKVLQFSLDKQAPGTQLHVFVIDDDKIECPSGLIILKQIELSESPFFKSVEKKYASTSSDSFRWALKPVIIGYLLEKGFEKVIYVDPDIYFTGNFTFILDLLNTYSILLTPHWADLDIINNEDSVFSVLRNGLFNAGFIAASQNGIQAIHWWAGMCQYKMEKRKELGLYDDQRYLDLLQVQFPYVHIIDHRGCNLAAWNIHSCKREMKNGRLLINGNYEPVFIHFTKDTIANIFMKNDNLLRPWLDEYCQKLSEFGYPLFSESGEIKPAYVDTFLYRIKHKIRLRTRIKRLLFRLAQKL